jgi:hypothetical protein
MSALDATAKRLFLTAITEDRCGELLDALFHGASATVDPEGRLVIISAEQMASLVRAEGDS